VARTTGCGCFSRWCERVELPHDVMTLDVATPLTLALNGDTAIFATTMAVELGSDVRHSGTCHRCTRWGWHMYN
jgi:hypothetical protein